MTDPLNIIVFGDIEFIYRAMRAVADIYNHNDMHKFAAALIGLFLLWSFVKWTIAPDKSPYPAREFVFGLVLYMAFGGLPNLSPKFSVNLLYDPYMYVSPPSGPKVVEDVPAMVALPYYMTTNLFSGLRNLVLPRFQVTGVPQSTGAATTPLHTLVRMYGMSETEVIDPYLEKSIDHYMRECFVYWYSLPGGAASDNASKIVAENVASPNFWTAFALPPAANWIHTRFYTQASPNGEIVQCTDSADSAHAQIAAALPNYRNAIALRLASQGFVSTDTMNSALFLQQALTSGTVTPHDLMTGLFVQQHIRSGLQGSNLGAWADKMVLEGGRQHVFQKAGESNLFVQIMIPVITAIEAFAVFIGPILMLLTVLGGMGLALIGKYLMLSLFIGLWGFLKVFTDWFAAVIALRAIQASSVEQSNPLTMGNVYQTFQEIEFYLGVAASLTVSIPFFAMFLLYGGIHSVMGVMRTIGTPQADGANMAPNMASTMNGGTMSMGDSVYQRNVSTGTWNDAVGASYAQPANMKTRSISEVATAGQDSAVQLSKQELASATTGLVSSFSQNQDFKNEWSRLASGGKAEGASTQNANQKVASLVYTMTNGDATKTDEALRALFQASGEGRAGVTGRIGGAMVGGLSAGVGGGVDLKAALSVAGSQGLTEEQIEMLQRADQHLNSDSELRSAMEGYNWSNVFGDGFTGTDGEAYQEQRSAANTFATAYVRNASISETYANTTAETASMGIHVGAMESTFRRHANSVEADVQNYMPGQDFSQAVRENNGMVTEAMFDLSEQYARGGTSIQDQGERYGNLAKFWQSQAELFTPGSELHSQLSTLSQQYQRLSGRMTDPNGLSAQHVGRADVEAPIESADAQDQKRRQEIEEGQDFVGARVAKVQNQSEEAIPNHQATIAQERAKLNSVDGPPKEYVQQAQAAEQRLAQQRDDMQHVQQMMLSGARLGISAMDSVGNVIDFFRGPSRLWGDGAEEAGQRMQSLFAQTGNSSGQIATGWSALSKDGTPNVAAQFRDNTPTEKAYAMNDTIMSMRETFGDNWKEVIDTSSEDGKRFLEAVGAFQVQKSALPQNVQQQMDDVSRFRISGALPDAAARDLIQNNGAKPLSTAPADSSSARSAMWIVQNNDELRQNESIRQLAGFTPNAERPASDGQPNGPDIPTPRQAPASGVAQSGAVRMFANDERDRIIAAGEHQIDPVNGFESGVNRDYNPERLRQGLDQYLSGQRDHRHGASILRDAETDTANRNHPAMLAAANSGLGNLADRLENGGFTNQAANLREQQHQDLAKWSNDGIILTPQTREQMQQIGTATLNGQSVDTSGAEGARTVVPTTLSSDTQLIWQGGQKTEGRYSVAITPRDYSSDVVIENNASGMAFPTGVFGRSQAAVEGSQRAAERNFVQYATMVGTDYANARAGFYDQLERDRQPPATFTSRDGVSRFQGQQQDDGTWRYTDTSNRTNNQGSYIFYPDRRDGLGEFRPSPDNPRFDERAPNSSKPKE